MDPPATPPLSSSTSDPGLLTSNERITIKRASEVKSLGGTGTFLHKYSQTTYNKNVNALTNLQYKKWKQFKKKLTSMLYFNWADIGMIGAESATVP